MNRISLSPYQSNGSRPFCPSPTGPLHLGSLVAAVGSYLFARQAGGLWLIRIEDLDTPRVVPGMADDMLRTLEALGFPWDGEVVRQSSRTAAYEAALADWSGQGWSTPAAVRGRKSPGSAPLPTAATASSSIPGSAGRGCRPARARGPSGSGCRTK